MQETHHQEERDQLPATKMAAAAANGGKSGDGVEDDMKIMQVHDSSLDYKGNLPLRASTGSWRASFFIIAIEFSERLSYFGIATNMINYMTKVMHQDLETAANSVNIWTGVTTVTPLLGGFLADAYLGRYSVILLSALLYVLGLGLLTMTQYIPSLKPCGSSLNLCERATNVHQVVFFVSAYLLSLATGGYKPCLESFGADQFDNNDSKERKQKMSFFNWWNVSLCFGLFLGSTLIVYLQDNVGWGVAFLILCIIMVVTVFVFILGRPIYRYRAPQGSPLTPMFQALIASMAKRKLDYPSDPAFLYEVPKSEKAPGTRLSHTNGLRFLDKAAIVEYTNGEAGEKKRNPWRLATVTQVEELKLVINMVPIWLTSLVFGIGIAQSATFFVKQANAMNRRVFNRFEIPAASVYTLTAIGMMSSVAFYDRLLLPYLRKATGNERGITILKRIGIGMVFLITSMVLSAMVERKRLNAFTKGKQVISVFWLVPQFLIMGIGDGFSLVGMQEYFYDQVPDSMRSLGMAFYLSVIGVGSFLSSFLITLVDSITGKNGGKRWIGKDVNHSRLDYYYCLLAVICTLNIFVFVCITKNYSYKVVEKSVDASVREDNKGYKGQESLA